MAAVFDFLPNKESARRAAAIDALVLDGRSLDVKVSSAIQDIPYERSIEGASTVTLKLIDPDGALLDSGLFSASVDIELPSPSAIVPKGQTLPVPTGDSLGFRLVGISTAGAILSLDFEDREVASMRAHKERRHGSRADMTRAEFIRSLVRAVKSPQRIRFWSPELHKRQPISSVRDITPKATKQQRREPGFGSFTPKVKGRDATRQQIRYLEQALDTAIGLKANDRVKIGLVEAMTQESVVNNDEGRLVQEGVGPLRGTVLIDVGVLHQHAGYWPASRNIPRDVKPFIAKLITTEKAHRDKSIGWCVDQVQRSYTVNTARQGKDYDQWESEATDTVAAYTGHDSLTIGVPEGSSTYRKRYEFRTTEAGADTREDWWSATGRLASEVNFRRFVDFGIFHYVGDDYLRRAAPRLILDRRNPPPGVLSIDVGDFDTGKPRRNQQGQNVGGAEIRVDVLVDVLEPPLGSVWIVQGAGPCDGRYLITNVRGSYLSPRATVTLSLPIPKLPEPAPDTGTHANTTENAPVRRSVSGSNIADAYDAAKAISAKRYPYVWGGGHRRAGVPDTGSPGTAHDELTDREHIGYDCSGSTAAVLLAGGMLPNEWKVGVPPSIDFAQRWGSPGRGRYMTVWANSVHVFIEFHGVSDANKTEHFGTGRWGKDWGGPGFNPNLHPHDGFTARHWTREANPITAPIGKPNLRP